MMEPQMSVVTVGMGEEIDVSNTEGIELVSVVSSLSFQPDVKMSCKLLEILISHQEKSRL